MRAALLGCLAGGGVSNATWTAGFGTFSNGNRTVSVGTSGNSYASTAAKISGKWYAEVRFTGEPYTISIGFVTNNESYDHEMLGNGHLGEWGYANTPGSFAEKITPGIYSGGVLLTSSAGYQHNDVLMLAINMSTGRMWWGRNGSWIAGNPGAGTSAMAATGGVVNSMFMACTLDNSRGGTPDTGAFTIIDLLLYQPPSGFEPL